MKKKINVKNVKIESYISLLIALVLTSKFIAVILASIKINESGTIPIILIATFVLFVILFVHNNYKLLNFNSMNILLVFTLTVLLLMNVVLKGVESFAFNYFIDFISYGILMYLLTLLPFSPQKVIYYCMLLGNFIIIAPKALINYSVSGYYYERLAMGTTYAMIPSIVATIIYVLFLRKELKVKIVLQLISYSSNAYLLYIVLMKGNRGAVLTIFILLLITVYIKLSRLIKGKIKLLIPIIFSFIMIAIVVLSINSVKLLQGIDNYLSKNGVEVAAIIKTMNMIEKNGLLGILNAREILYEQAIIMFSNSPIVGNGIGSFGDDGNMGFDYPHNIILQIMVEGGLIALIPSIVIFITLVYLIIKPWNYTNDLLNWRYLILFLFILCFPKLLISSYFWREQEFWLLIFSVMIYFQEYKTLQKEKIVDLSS